MELILESEGGGRLEKADGNFGDIINSLTASAKTELPWLWGIDPYGVTVFNVRQVPYVVDNLEKFKENLQSSESRQRVTYYLEFMKRIQQHTYIRLIGD